MNLPGKMGTACLESSINLKFQGIDVPSWVSPHIFTSCLFYCCLAKKPSATAALLICCCAGVPLWNWWLQRLLKAASISENCYKLPNICTHHTLSNISTLKAKSLYNWKSGPELIHSPSYMIYCFPSFVAEGSGVGDVDDQYVFFFRLEVELVFGVKLFRCIMKNIFNMFSFILHCLYCYSIGFPTVGVDLSGTFPFGKHIVFWAERRLVCRWTFVENGVSEDLGSFCFVR